MSRRFHKRFRNWNVEKRRLLGHRFLRMGGILDLEEAKATLQSTEASVHRRCLAARAIGLLNDDPHILDECNPRDDSPVARACDHASGDWFRRRTAESDTKSRHDAEEALQRLGLHSVDSAITLLNDKSATLDRRTSTALILGQLRCRKSVHALVNALAEGDQTLSAHCMSALASIQSRSATRPLMKIASRRFNRITRQEALYTIWQLTDKRAETMFIRLCRAIDTEDEQTRDMATEALGNTCSRLSSQKALAERLFDTSVSIRYAALCACCGLNYPPARMPDFLRKALLAKLEDPGRVDDHRVIAELAAQILNIGQS